MAHSPVTSCAATLSGQLGAASSLTPIDVNREATHDASCAHRCADSSLNPGVAPIPVVIELLGRSPPRLDVSPVVSRGENI